MSHPETEFDIMPKTTQSIVRCKKHMTLDIKAIGIGLFVFLLIGSIGYLILAFTQDDGRIAWAPLILPYVGVAIEGGLTGHRARQGKLFSAILLSCAIAVGFGLFNFVWSAAGMPADLGGLKGSVWVAVLSLPISLLLCVGSALVVIWKQRHKST